MSFDPTVRTLIPSVYMLAIIFSRRSGRSCIRRIEFGQCILQFRIRICIRNANHCGINNYTSNRHGSIAAVSTQSILGILFTIEHHDNNNITVYVYVALVPVTGIWMLTFLCPSDTRQHHPISTWKQEKLHPIEK